MHKKYTWKQIFKAILTVCWVVVLGFAGQLDKKELYRGIKKPHTE